MAAITTIVSTGQLIPYGVGVPGSLWAEIWRVPASTAGDTQTISSSLIDTILFIIGDVSHTALPLAAANTAALITLDTVAASNFVEFLVIGKKAASS